MRRVLSVAKDILSIIGALFTIGGGLFGAFHLVQSEPLKLGCSIHKLACLVEERETVCSVLPARCGGSQVGLSPQPVVEPPPPISPVRSTSSVIKIEIPGEHPNDIGFEAGNDVDRFVVVAPANGSIRVEVKNSESSGTKNASVGQVVVKNSGGEKLIERAYVRPSNRQEIGRVNASRGEQLTIEVNRYRSDKAHYSLIVNSLQ